MDETRRKLIGAGLLLAVLPALLPLVQPLLQNGDSAVYNDQVDRLAFGERTTHIGYIALGVAFRAVLPGSTDSVMNAMTVTLGVVGLLAVYFTAYGFSRSVAGSLIAAAAVLCLPAYLRGMLLSEVDVPLAACAALAFALWVCARPLWAGLVYGLAMLISPLGALLLPAFLIVPPLGANGERLRRTAWAAFRPLVAFALGGLIVYLPVVLAHRANYLYGGRGLFVAPRSPFWLEAHALSSARFAQAQLLPLLPLYAAGLCGAVLRRRVALVAGLCACVVTSLVLGERFGTSVPVQLPAVVLLSTSIALGVSTGPRPLRVLLTCAALFAIGWTGVGARARLQAEMKGLARTRAVLMAIREATPLPAIVVGIGAFSAARRAERWLHGTTKQGLVLGRGAFVDSCEAIAGEPTERAIWFMGRPVAPPCRALMRRYEWKKLDAGGKRYHVLLPKRG